MQKGFTKIAIWAVLAATIGVGVVYGVHAREAQAKLQPVAQVVVADEPQSQPTGSATAWPLPMLTPSI